MGSDPDPSELGYALNLPRPERVTWIRRTNKGRVVYNRKKNHFRWRDVFRISHKIRDDSGDSAEYPWFLATIIENIDFWRKNGVFWSDFDPNDLLPALNILTRELQEALFEEGIPTRFPAHLSTTRYRRSQIHFPWQGNPFDTIP